MMIASTATKRVVAWVVFTITTLMLIASLPVNVLALHGHPNGNMAFSVILLSLPVVGILIARRRPDNRVAWMLLAIGALVGLGSLTEPYATYALTMHPGELPAAGVVAAVNGALWIPTIGLTGTYLILAFPDGRLPSSRWRPVAWTSGITIALLVIVFVFGAESFDQNPAFGIRSRWTS